MKAKAISNQLGAWIRNLRDSDKRGQRYVTDKLRSADKTVKDRADFIVELERIRAGEQPGTNE